MGSMRVATPRQIVTTAPPKEAFLHWPSLILVTPAIYFALVRDFGSAALTSLFGLSVIIGYYTGALRYLAATVAFFAGTFGGLPLGLVVSELVNPQARFGINNTHFTWGCTGLASFVCFALVMRIGRKLVDSKPIAQIVNRFIGTTIGIAQGTSVVIAVLAGSALVEQSLQIPPGHNVSASRLAAIRRIQLITTSVRQSVLANFIQEQLARFGGDQRLNEIPWVEAINKSLQASTINEESVGG